MWFPKGNEFFQLINLVSRNVAESANLLEAFVTNFPASDHELRGLKEHEKEGDRLTHQAIELLNKTFITPIDREDIHSLINAMDDILDYIYAGAYRMSLYKIPYVNDEFRGLTRIVIQTTEQLCEAAQRLKDLKTPEVILAQCIEVNRLESEADEAHRRAIANLFDKEKDPITVIKLKEILDHLETATDYCQDASNVIEGIVLKHA